MTTSSLISRSGGWCDCAGGRLMSDEASFASALQRAKAALDLRRPDEALRHLDRALASAPQDDRLWCLRAQAMLQLDRPEDALEAARRAAGLDPTEEWSHRLASVALVNLACPEEAVEEAREAVRLCPKLALRLEGPSNARSRP